jgi:hypothetical protein
MIRYILANPVRAQLVTHPLEYPFSGSAVFERNALTQAFDNSPAFCEPTAAG